MLKIDLHTHSTGSIDGSITIKQYKSLLENKIIDTVAITDHDNIDFAQEAQKVLGEDKVIVGEEISTLEGEVIGLYLKKAVAPNQSAVQTVKQIKAQGGLVLIPHPFETVRKGITLETLDTIATFVDIVEAPNGRSLQPGDKQAIGWAKRHNKIICGSSDAHRSNAVGKTHTLVAEQPTSDNLLQILRSAKTTYKRPSLFDLLAPKYNRYVRRKKRT